MSQKYKIKRKPAAKDELKKEAKKLNWKLWLFAFASILFFFTAYQTALYFMFEYIVHIYAALATGFALVFGIMNRGFGKFEPESITFPEDYTEEKRKEIIDKEQKRRKLARKFLIPLSGILFTLAFDMIYLIYLQPLIG